MDRCKKSESSNDIFRVISQQQGRGGGIEPSLYFRKEKGPWKGQSLYTKINYRYKKATLNQTVTFSGLSVYKGTQYNPACILEREGKKREVRARKEGKIRVLRTLCYASRFLTRHLTQDFVVATFCRFLKAIQNLATLLHDIVALRTFMSIATAHL